MATHLSTSRPYCRVLMWWPGRLRLGNSQSSCRAPLSLSHAADASPGGAGDLEGCRTAGLLLNHCGALAKHAAWRDVADPLLHEVAATKLGVDAAVEERQVTNPPIRLQLLPDCPDVPGLEWRLGADDPPRIPWRRWRKEEITLSHARFRRLATPPCCNSDFGGLRRGSAAWPTALPSRARSGRWLSCGNRTFARR